MPESATADSLETKPRPAKPGGLDMGKQVLLALLLGVLAGIFFGELTGSIKFLGDIYIGLLQMMVLPYIMISLIGGIGKLTLEQALQLAKYAILVLLLMWSVIGIVLILLPLALPELTSASFYSTSLVEPAKPVRIIDIFIPKNVFASLSNNQIPAVVIFCIALGVSLITSAEKKKVFDVLDVLGEAVMRVIKTVVRLTPVGVFVMTANAAGTMEFADLGKLQGYFILYTIAVLILGFWVLPGLVACLTPFKFKDVVSIAWSAMVLSFAAAKVLVALPLIIESIKELFEKYEVDDPNAVTVAEMLVPISYPFPNTGKLLSLFFVPFAGWFIGAPLSFGDYPSLLSSGLLSYFGNVAVAMPFLLDLNHLPADMFQLFLLTGVYCGRMSDALGAMDMFTFAALVACASSGMMRVRWRRLIFVLSGAAIVFLLAIIGVRGYLTYASEGAYDKDMVVQSMQLKRQDGPSTILESSPNPVPLETGQSRIDRIKDRGVIRIGYHPDRLPFSYTNLNGDLVGFDVDMAHELAAALEVEIEFVPFSFNTLDQQLAEDHFDVAMGGVYGTAQQSGNLRFSDPYLFATMALIVPDHRDKEFSSASSIRRLDTTTIAIHSSLFSEDVVGDIKRQFPDAELVEITSYREFFEQEEVGDLADSLLTGAESGSAWTLLYPHYQVVTPWADGYTVPLVYPFSGGGDSPMDEFLDHWVMLQQHDGTIDGNYRYWILGQGAAEASPRWSILRNVLGWVD